MNNVCPNCYQPFFGAGCPYCALRGGQYVGQATTSDSGQGGGSIVQTSSLTTDSDSGSSSYIPASWDDLELLYPPLWGPWAVGKLLDPSQEVDSTTRRNQLGSIAYQLNTVVKSCTTLPQNDVTNWNAFAQTFVPWFSGDNTSSILNPGLDTEQARLLQDQLRGWQVEISKYCAINMPLLPKATPTLAGLGQEALEDVGKYFDTIKFLFVVGAGLMLVSVAIIGVENTRRIITKALV